MPDLPDRLRLVIFDLDGVIYRGTDAVEGAAELVELLRVAGIAVRFATNNSMLPGSGYVERLLAMGIEVSVDEVVTSTWATMEHLRRVAPGVRRILAVGAPGMVDELRAGGFEAIPAAAAAPIGYAGGPLPASYDAVVAGLDPAFDYLRLAAAVTAVRSGARFVATNADRRYPTAEGFMPGAGSMVAAIAAASGIDPDVVGKPQPAIFTAILEAANVDPAEALVIGDNPDADVVAARRAGIASILVMTGVADAALLPTLDGERRPELVAEGPREVASLMRRWISR